MINITQEQKQVLNDNGVMVAEFKLWCKKVSKAFSDIWYAIADYLQVVADSIRNALNELSKIFSIPVDNRDVNRIMRMSPPERYRYCRVKSYPYQMFIKRVTQYRCRNNC